MILYEEGQYAVFAIADVDTVQRMKRYVPFMQLPGMETQGRNDCIQKLQAYSQIYSPLPVNADDQLLLLVTCEGTEENRRVARVYGRFDFRLRRIRFPFGSSGSDDRGTGKDGGPADVRG